MGATTDKGKLRSPDMKNNQTVQTEHNWLCYDGKFCQQIKHLINSVRTSGYMHPVAQ